jgi:hypothetical protein
MKLIGVTGAKRSGKDTVGRFLAEQGFRNMSFAKPLKDAAALLLSRPHFQCEGNGYDREEIMPEWGFSMRWFLQRLGTDCMRNQICQDFWLKRAQVSLDEHVRKDPDSKFVFTDVRFLNEAEFIRKNGGKIIRVIRDGVGERDSHVSEMEMNSIQVDATVANNGTYSDLYNNVERVMYELIVP